MTKLIEPYGGALKVGYLPREDVAAAKRRAVECPSWDLTRRQLCDIKLLLNGGFSPLDGYLTEADYQSVVEDMRLGDGTLWPVPVTLDVAQELADTLEIGQVLALRDPEGFLVALLDISAKWQPNKRLEARAVYGTEDTIHPGVDTLFNHTGPVYLGGRLVGIEQPVDYDFRQLRFEPEDMRRRFDLWGWSRIVAFHTRRPIHRAQQELTYRAAKQAEANLLLHPAIGVTGPGDVEHFTRVRCYERVLQTYPEQTTALCLVPFAPRLAGPREAVWHAIIRRNYGCTHLIVGPDHASPDAADGGGFFYKSGDAQALVAELEPELGVTPVPFKRIVYVQERNQHAEIDDVQHGETVLEIPDGEFARRLRQGIDIPDWYSFPAVVNELRRNYPPTHLHGFTILFTGLPGAGKSTLANALMVKLMERGDRPVTLLDGDLVRKHLSSELGFSREHRNINVLRIGYVASEITKAGGVAICAPIAPYASIRRTIREMVEVRGGFVEVYVSTPIEVCESRDRKGLYAKARAGVIANFTGVDDPYEAPTGAELEINTNDVSPEEAAQRILLKLEAIGLIR